MKVNERYLTWLGCGAMSVLLIVVAVELTSVAAATNANKIIRLMFFACAIFFGLITCAARFGNLNVYIHVIGTSEQSIAQSPVSTAAPRPFLCLDAFASGFTLTILLLIAWDSILFATIR